MHRNETSFVRGEETRRKKKVPSIDFVQTIGKYLLRSWLFIGFLSTVEFVYAVVISVT